MGFGMTLSTRAKMWIHQNVELFHQQLPTLWPDLTLKLHVTQTEQPVTSAVMCARYSAHDSFVSGALSKPSARQHKQVVMDVGGE